MPFITEEIFCTLKELESKGEEEESIMISSWPEYQESLSFAAEEEAVETIKQAVKSIRGVRSGMNVPPSRKAAVIVVSAQDRIREIFEGSRVFFSTLAAASEVTIQADKTGIAQDAVSAVIPGATLYMPLSDLVDIEKEIARLNKERDRLTGEIKRSQGMLSNENFVKKAPAAKIKEEEEKLAKYTNMMNQVLEQLKHLGC